MTFLDRQALRAFQDSLLENLGMLVASGMPLQSALEAIRKEAPDRAGKALGVIAEQVGNGEPLWSAFDKAGFLPDYVISLLRIGEESGKLPESLSLVADQITKQKALRGKIRSAMLYPVFVLSLMALVGLGIAWFILPKLSTVFASLKVSLPLPTRVLIWVGALFAQRGLVLVPAVIVALALVLYMLFYAKPTRFIGQAIVFRLPVFHRLVQETELARFGYLFGTLLKAGIPITAALASLEAGATFRPYKALYGHLRGQIEQGESVAASFASFRGSAALVPATVQQLLAAAEQSGKLPDTLLRVGGSYEERTESTAKNLTILLEPVLLVVISVGVLAVALAVILPIYSLLGGLAT